MIQATAPDTTKPLKIACNFLLTLFFDATDDTDSADDDYYAIVDKLDKFKKYWSAFDLTTTEEVEVIHYVQDLISKYFEGLTPYFPRLLREMYISKVVKKKSIFLWKEGMEKQGKGADMKYLWMSRPMLKKL